MKKLLSLLFAVCCLSSCDRFHNDNWQNYYQQYNINVTGGSTSSGGNSPFGGAFGGDFNYSPRRGSSYYWGEGGSPSHYQKYQPYSTGSSKQYYRGTDDNGRYRSSRY